MRYVVKVRNYEISENDPLSYGYVMKELRGYHPVCITKDIYGAKLYRTRKAASKIAIKVRERLSAILKKDIIDCEILEVELVIKG